MSNDSKAILKRVSGLNPGDYSRTIYDDWSPDYDTHLLHEFGYVSPAVAARTICSLVESREIEIMDYGCGTGLVGESLRMEGYTCIDGVDISPGMLGQAQRKACYRHLVCADLTNSVALADSCYDLAVCVGSMGAGHVAARHLPELLRVLKAGGFFVIIINHIYFTAEGFEQAFRQLENDGIWEIRQLEQFNYMTGLDRPGWLLVARKI